MPNANEWQNEFLRHLEHKNITDAIACLDLFKTNHAGTPPQKIKDRAIKLIHKKYRDQPERLYEYALAFANSSNDGAKEIGVYLLPEFYARNSEEIDEIVACLGDDDNWEVREWAAGALAYIISGSFSRIFPKLAQWVQDPSANIRRMTAVAIGFATRDCTSEQCQQLLPLLTPLMADTDKYVSKNMGAYAVSNCALKHQPALVETWLRTIDDANEHAAWNLAMVLTTAEAAKQFVHIQFLLPSLLADERPKVKRAVQKGVKNLAKRIPTQFAQFEMKAGISV
ncbi:MAG: HEAT repeat domain-containing protein [Chloroflexota bacterium]